KICFGSQPGKAPRPPSTYILPSSATPTTSSSPWGIGFIWLQRPCASAGPAVRSTASATTPAAPARNSRRVVSISPPRSFILSPFYSEKLRGGAAEHRGALRVAQAGRGENVLYGGLSPGKGVIGAQHDARAADLRGEVAQRFGREHQRIEVKLLQIFRRPLLQRNGRAALGEGEADVIRARRIGRQVAAAMGGADLEAGKTR